MASAAEFHSPGLRRGASFPELIERVAGGERFVVPRDRFLVALICLDEVRSPERRPAVVIRAGRTLTSARLVALPRGGAKFQ